MKCHYTYTENGEKVLIPGCIGTAAMGIEHCTCLNRMIKKIYRKNENRTRRTTETKNRL